MELRSGARFKDPPLPVRKPPVNDASGPADQFRFNMAPEQIIRGEDTEVNEVNLRPNSNWGGNYAQELREMAEKSRVDNEKNSSESANGQSDELDWFSDPLRVQAASSNNLGMGDQALGAAALPQTRPGIGSEANRGETVDKERRTSRFLNSHGSFDRELVQDQFNRIFEAVKEAEKILPELKAGIETRIPEFIFYKKLVTFTVPDMLREIEDEIKDFGSNDPVLLGEFDQIDKLRDSVGPKYYAVWTDNKELVDNYQGKYSGMQWGYQVRGNEILNFQEKVKDLENKFPNQRERPRTGRPTGTVPKSVSFPERRAQSGGFRSVSNTRDSSAPPNILRNIQGNGNSETILGGRAPVSSNVSESNHGGSTLFTPEVTEINHGGRGPVSTRKDQGGSFPNSEAITERDQGGSNNLPCSQTVNQLGLAALLNPLTKMTQEMQLLRAQVNNNARLLNQECSRRCLRPVV